MNERGYYKFHPAVHFIFVSVIFHGGSEHETASEGAQERRLKTLSRTKKQTNPMNHRLSWLRLTHL